MKSCSKCNRIKEKRDYHKNSACIDGLHKWCKLCRKQETQRYLDRYYPNREVGKKGRKANSLQEQIKRRKARITLNHGVRDGKVIKSDCKICGKLAEAHHPNYNKPLKVIWLCKEHHFKLHTNGTRYKQIRQTH